MTTISQTSLLKKISGITPARRQKGSLPLSPRYVNAFLIASMVVVAGLMMEGRSFAYIGVPPLFVSEIFIFAAVILNPSDWVTNFCLRLRQGNMTYILILLTLAWGLIETFRGILNNRDVMQCIRTLAFNYYPMLLPIGISLGHWLNMSSFFKAWKWFCVVYSIYAMLFCFVLNDFEYYLPWGDQVAIFGSPNMGGLLPVSILIFHNQFYNWKWRYLILAIGSFPIFFDPGRGTFLGLISGFLIASWGNPKNILKQTLIAFIIVLLLSLLSPYLPSKLNRGGSVDPTVIVARLVSTFDPDGAYHMLMRRGLYTAAANVDSTEGSANWRATIWSNVIKSLDSTSLWFFGHGHGENIRRLTPDNQEITTPHCFVIYALYYTGGIGVILYLLLFIFLIESTKRVNHKAIRLFMLASIANTMIEASVGNFLETPFGAVRFFLLTGICLGLAEVNALKKVEE